MWFAKFPSGVCRSRTRQAGGVNRRKEEAALDNNDHQNDITMMTTVARRLRERQAQTPHLGTFPNEAEKERGEYRFQNFVLQPRTESNRVIK